MVYTHVGGLATRRLRIQYKDIPLYLCINIYTYKFRHMFLLAVEGRNHQRGRTIISEDRPVGACVSTPVGGYIAIFIFVSIHIYVYVCVIMHVSAWVYGLGLCGVSGYE